MAYLTLQYPGTTKAEHHRLKAPGLTIGRDLGCEITLDDSNIARQHVQILWDGKDCVMKPLAAEGQSSLLLNGEKISMQGSNKLKNGSIVQIGPYMLAFHDGDPPSPDRTPQGTQSSDEDDEESTDPDIIEIKMIKKVLAALDNEKLPSLEVLTGQSTGRKLLLAEDRDSWTIGREAGCELRLTDTVISRRHAVLERRWGGFSLKDMGSKNGTVINGKRVTEWSLKDGDEIFFGNVQLACRNPGALDLVKLEERYRNTAPKQTQEKTALEQGPQDTSHPSAPSAAAFASMGEEAKPPPQPAKTTTVSVPQETTSQNTLSPRRKSFSPLEWMLLLIGIGVLGLVMWLVQLIFKA